MKINVLFFPLLFQRFHAVNKKQSKHRIEREKSKRQNENKVKNK